MSKSKITENKISELKQDKKNFNKGTKKGEKLMRRSIEKFGLGRSILLDKDNNIIAGNKTQEMAKKLGYDDVIVVETDGSKLVAVKRTDVDLNSPEGRELALADNATNEANLDWDNDALADAQQEFGFDAKDWGLDPMKDAGDELYDEYSQNTGKVMYEPKETHRKVEELYTPCTKFDEDIEKIENEEIKEMLKLRAAWFTNFNFAKIADYYAYQATPEEQRIFERLGLVLLDLGGAIENGYSAIIEDFRKEENHDIK